MTDQQEVPYALSTLDDLEWSIRTWLQKRCIFGAKYKTFNEDRPTLPAVRWATNRSEAAKMDNFYRMQRVIFQTFWILMTQRQEILKDACGN